VTHGQEELDSPSERWVHAAIDLPVDPKVQDRVNTLGARANDGTLTADENAEYEALINAADFISILKLKAKTQLE